MFLSIEQQIEKFWTIEDIHTEQTITSSHEYQICETNFTETTTRSKDGRFIVKLPLRDISSLGKSRELTLKRYKRLEVKFKNDVELYEQYQDFMSEYKNLGHMREVNEQDDGSMAYYIPHHSVFKADGNSRIRVVFDASMKTSTNISINETHAYVVTTDIAKMYRQVLMHEEPLQRIFWRDSPEQGIKTYDLNAVSYGMASAPYLAIRCLHQLALEFAKEYPKTCDVMMHDFYVDDCLTGTETLTEAFMQ
ncbi:hypothetical protein Trydic_g18 [Trypoxylus dichotomus]